MHSSGLLSKVGFGHVLLMLWLHLLQLNCLGKSLLLLLLTESYICPLRKLTLDSNSSVSGGAV